VTAAFYPRLLVDAEREALRAALTATPFAPDSPLRFLCGGHVDGVVMVDTAGQRHVLCGRRQSQWWPAIGNTPDRIGPTLATIAGPRDLVGARSVSTTGTGQGHSAAVDDGPATDLLENAGDRRVIMAATLVLRDSA
jgi:hypothetical protein